MEKYYKHSTAIVESENIGEKTRIHAFSHVLPGAKIGSQCNLCDHTFVENDVIIGDRVTLKCGVQVWDGITLEDDVFVGPNATFTNDPFPRSRQYLASYTRTVIRQGASIGANSTLLPGVTIGQYAMIGAGAVVTKDVPPYAKVVGNPARIVGYIESQPHPPMDTPSTILPPQTEISVRGVKIFELPLISDLRGSLTFSEYPKDLPFIPQRYFLIFDVPSKDVRGEHAHRTCQQFLVCVKGSCVVVADDGVNRQEFLLDRPNMGLYLPPMVWGIQYKYTPGTVLMVLASDIYKADDYIRDYDVFLKAAKEHD